MQKGIIKLKNKPFISYAAAVGGEHEHDGPLGDLLDFHDRKNEFFSDTWEKAEAEMQRMTLELALKKGNYEPCDIDALFAGDLMNQCTSSAYGLLSYDIPFCGLYGACSTAAESILLASLCVNAGYFNRAAAVTSSHNGAAERQFRFPLEYGSQRAPTSQWTVTGAGAFIIERENEGLYGARVEDVMLGRTVDRGISDANNMGAAMAPAAADTIVRYLDESGRSPDDIPLIATGDLGYEGHSILLELVRNKGYDISKVCTDCGILIYNQSTQDVHSGGSGCGCSAVTLACHLLRKIAKCEIGDLLFVGTGALMSPDALKQGRTIPGVAHLVHIVSDKKEDA